MLAWRGKQQTIFIHTIAATVQFPQQWLLDILWTPNLTNYDKRPSASATSKALLLHFYQVFTFWDPRELKRRNNINLKQCKVNTSLQPHCINHARKGSVLTFLNNIYQLTITGVNCNAQCLCYWVRQSSIRDAVCLFSRGRWDLDEKAA